MAVIHSPMAGGDQLTEQPVAPLDPGAPVEVRNHFDGRWAKGFEITSCSADGYRVRRLSDGRELPTVFDGHDIRPRRERKRDTWWY
jgi:hypothetical protein